MNAAERIESGWLEMKALGMASDEEARMVSEWALADNEVKQELEEIEICLEKLARYYGLEPASETRSRTESVLFKEELEKEALLFHASPDDRRLGMYQWWSVAATLLFLLMAGFGFWGYKNLVDTQEKLAQVKTEYQNLSVENQKLYNDQQKMVALSNYLRNEGAVQVMLHSTRKDPMNATLFWNPKTNEIWLIGTNLPHLPRGKQYQMWGIVDGKPADAGVFNASSGGTMLQPMKPMHKPSMFAVTIENEGGSAHPTMNSMCLMAEL